MSKDAPLAGVLGYPISHSKSPRIHGHWLEKYGLRGFYMPLPVAPAHFENVLRTLPRMGYVGANVTIPHKVRALKCADIVTDRASLIGAANTLIFRPDGKVMADNTDGYGFIENIRQAAPKWDFKEGSAVVIGAGGAARAVVVSLLDVGVPEIILSNRTRIKAESLKEEFSNRIKVVDWAGLGSVLEDVKTIVNATSLGMSGQADLRVPLDGLRPGQLVTDLVYDPLETPLLAQAREAGCTVVDGLGMLLHQAVPGFERWFGHRPVVDNTLRKMLLS